MSAEPCRCTGRAEETPYQPRRFAATRLKMPGAAMRPSWTGNAGEMSGAVCTGTGSLVRCPTCSKTSRRSISPQAEHMKVWCSKPGTGMVSSWTTFIKFISAPHAKQRIALLLQSNKQPFIGRRWPVYSQAEISRRYMAASPPGGEAVLSHGRFSSAAMSRNAAVTKTPRPSPQAAGNPMHSGVWYMTARTQKWWGAIRASNAR
jgi:hypothetical protein